jgi:hypothetical protein
MPPRDQPRRIHGKGGRSTGSGFFAEDAVPP